MPRTVQDGIDRVLQILQDEDGVRYTHEQVLSHFVDVVAEARSIRPDLFVGAYATPLPTVLAPGDAFPLPDQFFNAACMFVVGALELRDDEFAVDGRAALLLQTLTKKLVSGT